jgi:hypothetical protein
VASLIAIDAPSDPRIADYVGLTDVHLRRSLETAHGLFMAEGEMVIKRAVSAGYQMRSLLVTKDRLAGLADLAGLSQVQQAPVYVVSAEVAEAITGFRVHRGALASMYRRPIPPLAEVLARAQRVVVLEDLVDHENVGAIFRCAAGLGSTRRCSLRAARIRSTGGRSRSRQEPCSPCHTRGCLTGAAAWLISGRLGTVCWRLRPLPTRGPLRRPGWPASSP